MVREIGDSATDTVADDVGHLTSHGRAATADLDFEHGRGGFVSILVGGSGLVRDGEEGVGQFELFAILIGLDHRDLAKDAVFLPGRSTIIVFDGLGDIERRVLFDRDVGVEAFDLFGRGRSVRRTDDSA